MLIEQLHSVYKSILFYIIGAIAARYLFRDYTQQVAINNLNCTGSEERVIDCSHNVLIQGSNTCKGDGVAVFCQPVDSKLLTDKTNQF